jgi:hypothetical protein
MNQELLRKNKTIICMRIINKTISIILYLLVSVTVFGQKKYSIPKTKEIIINYKDSIVKSNIFIINEKVKIDNSIFYHWYSMNNIYVNRGGFSGNLLHGKYCVFDSNDKMKTEGFFTNGVKEGEWKRWYKNGELASVEVWEDGTRNGTHIFYDYKGSIIKHIDYKDDLIHGDFIVYLNNSTIKKEYKKGQEIIKNDKEKKSSENKTQLNSESDKENGIDDFFHNIFNRSQKELNKDELDKEEEEEDLSEKEKEDNFFNKLLFWKKDEESKKDIDKKSEKKKEEKN